jgi:hypothetical protein
MRHDDDDDDDFTPAAAMELDITPAVAMELTPLFCRPILRVTSLLYQLKRPTPLALEFLQLKNLCAWRHVRFSSPVAPSPQLTQEVVYTLAQPILEQAKGDDIASKV